MKYTYSAPVVEIMSTEMEDMLAGSVTSVEKGIGYGGVDEDGTKDPSSRRQWDVWEDEEGE